MRLQNTMRFNLNLLECKGEQRLGFYGYRDVLISTYWNVKDKIFDSFSSAFSF